MARISYPGTSPYAATPQTSWAISNYVHRRIPKSIDDQLMVITPDFQYRPDKLSRQIYGTEAYWWVFMARNLKLIRDPIWDLKTGISIYIPPLASLRNT
jgi:uncharacterized Fe-S radical SAM superfamily protein PflX